MGSNNSKSHSHRVGDKPNAFRDDNVYQALNDLDEEDTGRGFAQVLKLPVPNQIFTDKIVTWEDSGMTKKRSEVQFNRGVPSVAFVNTIVKTIFAEDGTTVKAVITSTLTRTGSLLLNNVDTVTVRP